MNMNSNSTYEQLSSSSINDKMFTIKRTSNSNVNVPLKQQRYFKYIVSFIIIFSFVFLVYFSFTKTKQLASLSQKKQSLQHEIQLVSLQQAEMQQSLTKLISDHEALKKQNSEIISSIETHKQKRNELRSQTDNNEQTLSSIRSQISSTKEDIEDIALKNKQLRRKISNEGSDSDYTYEINKLKRKTKELQQELEELEANEHNVGVDSEILVHGDDISQIKKWVCSNSSKCRLRLIYRANEDNFNSEIFHRKVDAESPTLAVIEDTDGTVFGGYTTKTWRGDDVVKSDEDAFLFNLNHKKKYPVQDTNNAIYCDVSNFVVFGRGDLVVTNNKSSSSFPYSYGSSRNEEFELTGGKSRFKLKHFEMFAVDDS